jgi:transcriptional regulator with XRE-family HTH domain
LLLTKIFCGATIAIMKTVGQALREARIACGQSQEELAETLEVSQAFLSEVERGRRPLSAQRRERLPYPIRIAVIEAEYQKLLEKIAVLERERAQLAPGAPRRARKDGGTQ